MSRDQDSGRADGWRDGVSLAEARLFEARLSRRRFLKIVGAGVAIQPLASLLSGLEANSSAQKPAVPYAAGPPQVSWTRLPRWRGFNLLSKFEANSRERNRPYEEWDFDVIADWGFDFVRLPLDYRIWTISPGVYREEPLKEIDQAISWAQARGIHVNLAFHRAPGYRVGRPPEPEPFDLWGDGPTSEEARRQFTAQWRMFAQRYRGIPSTQLSFNLVNEPPDISGGTYHRVAAIAVEAIRGEDPGRLIVADGTSAGWGVLRPVPELVSLRVAQSMRGYAPSALTSYRASWVPGSDQLPLPTWPIMLINPYLYGDAKEEFQSPLLLRVSISEPVQMIIRINVVTNRATLRVRVDGATVFAKDFQPGPGQGEWKESRYLPQWGIYQAVYDREYEVRIHAGAREIAIDVTKGDWMTFSEIRLSPFPRPPQEVVLRPNDQTWGIKQVAVVINPDGTLGGGRVYDRTRLWAQYVEPWKKFADSGVGVHVGEWGAYNRTPHDVTLAWMTDCLENWKRADFGWALWELRGEFGVLDSGRTDVTYENFRGHKLDRKMLELLLRG